jgi:hypothetical protein
MSFDSDPRDEEYQFECPNCGGNVEQAIEGRWCCDACDYVWRE